MVILSMIVSLLPLKGEGLGMRVKSSTAGPAKANPAATSALKSFGIPLKTSSARPANFPASSRMPTSSPPLTDRAVRLPNVDPARWTRNRPLSSREVGRLLKKYSKNAGLDPSKIRVHTLRHTAAMLRKQAGDDIDQISSFLGHSSLSTTQIYLHRLSGQTDSSWLRVAALLGL